MSNFGGNNRLQHALGVNADTTQLTTRSTKELI